MRLLPTNEIELKIREPSRITTIIPHARVYDTHIVRMRHGLEETKILRNMGIAVPSPIVTNYDWPGEYPFPYKHQIDTASFATLHKRCFVLNDMGLMKTLSTLWAADYLMNEGIIRRVLVLSTLSCLETTWYREIFRNLMHRHGIIVHGTKKQRIAALQENVDFYIMNHHGMLVVREELAARKDLDLVILDEGSMLRNSQTRIYKEFAKYLRPEQWLWILSGKPCPNGPTDAWALARLVSPSRVPQFFTRWKDETMRKVSMFKWVPREGSTQRMFDAMQPAIRFNKKDCLDLPPVILQDRQVPMSTMQNEWYQAMKARLVVYAQQHQVTAANAAILLGKLLQICAGAVKTDAGEYISVDMSGRLKVLDECIAESAAKVLVLVPYIGAMRAVTDHLRKYMTVEQLDGSTSRTERARSITAFKDHQDPQGLVAHPKIMAHGHNLTEADTIVWFSPVHSLDTYDQANERMARPGQRLTTNIIHLGGCPLEWGVYKVLRNKGQAQEEFLELFKQELAL